MNRIFVLAILLFLQLNTRAQSQARTESSRSLVLVIGRSQAGLVLGTGIVIDNDLKWVLTTWHFWKGVTDPAVVPPIIVDDKVVVSPSIYMRTYFQKRAWQIRLLCGDSSSDLAILHVPDLAGSQSISLGCDSSSRDNLHIVGNPLSRNMMWYSSSAQWIDCRQRAWHYDSGQSISALVVECQTKDELSSGFSGGPLINKNGELLGMVLASTGDKNNRALIVSHQQIARLIAFARLCHTLKHISKKWFDRLSFLTEINGTI